MTEYWESRYKNEGAMWKSEPSDSAILALTLFKAENINNILIPGIGYGRNARLFLENGFVVTGIEISLSAIEMAQREMPDCTIHHGSVTRMPFDGQTYDGIFCYALIHLLSLRERHKFLLSCCKQLKNNGLMIFVVASKKSEMFGRGKSLGVDRFELEKGLKVFFYDNESVIKEFSDFGIIRNHEIDEPVKFMEGQQPVKLIFVVCRKR